MVLVVVVCLSNLISADVETDSASICQILEIAVEQGKERRKFGQDSLPISSDFL